MKKYTEENFNLNVEANRFVFQGKIERSDYSELNKFLCEAEKGVAGDELEFDFTGLEYLNSSGIRSIAVMFLESKKRVKLLINSNLTWQKVGLVPLSAIKPNGAITVE